ncbi:hypothetical protein [Namhaeicola litoreus]|uniref:Uncharacterized protein n=1 Tax=Namhaeicola litoreus TaxID=1052145 RepID=A0ABW3XYY4_9FLAO
MGLSGKHQFGSIGETRVTFVEKNTTQERMEFLKKLLEVNGFEVITEEEKRKTEDDPQLYTVGVTDMVFNPTVYVFQRRLKTIDGLHKVTPDYWNQVSEETHPQYWKND